MLYRILSTEQQKIFETRRQIDIYSIPGLARFRVNVYFQRESLGAPPSASSPPSEDDRAARAAACRQGLHDEAARPRPRDGPDRLGQVDHARRGDRRDQPHARRPHHDHRGPDRVPPPHKRCIVNQREIGPDATSFAEALRGALRQDPDVILLGEMRDLETIGTALTAAETGHLVFATLHTQDAPSTVDRLIDVFPAAQQEQIRVQIASTLQGIVTQTLLPTLDGKGASPPSRSSCPTTRFGTSSARRRSSRSTRSCRPTRAAVCRRSSRRCSSSSATGRSAPRSPCSARAGPISYELLQRHGFLAADEAGAGGLRVAGG